MLLLTNALIINEGKQFLGSVLIENLMIKAVYSQENTPHLEVETHDLQGKILMPGVIDDQVHFRDPGLTYKGNIQTESRAAVAGGVTSYMDMPNNNPPILTQQLLEQKYADAATKSMANFSFYMGASNDNLEEVLKTNPKNVCGIKVFMGSSTGNMLVDNRETLEGIFKNAPTLVATHCEDETTIRRNTQEYKEKYGEQMPFKYHSEIRSAEACKLSSLLAVELAQKHGTRLHVLHLSSGSEMELFRNDIPLKDKLITAEVCVHHLWFNQDQYDTYGARIKWNPAIKAESDRLALIKALNDDTLDVVATDHAPHTAEEKENSYFKTPSGGPLVQHSLVAMLQLAQQGYFDVNKVVEKMCHAPAIAFKVEKRGFIREGYFADLVVVDRQQPWTVDPSNILYHVGWSPFEGQNFDAKVISTYINGTRVYHQGEFIEDFRGQRITFSR